MSSSLVPGSFNTLTRAPFHRYGNPSGQRNSFRASLSLNPSCRLSRTPTGSARFLVVARDTATLAASTTMPARLGPGCCEPHLPVCGMAHEARHGLFRSPQGASRAVTLTLALTVATLLLRNGVRALGCDGGLAAIPGVMNPPPRLDFVTRRPASCGTGA
jgi:hypothetical protein